MFHPEITPPWFNDAVERTAFNAFIANEEGLFNTESPKSDYSLFIGIDEDEDDDDIFSIF